MLRRSCAYILASKSRLSKVLALYEVVNDPPHLMRDLARFHDVHGFEALAVDSCKQATPSIELALALIALLHKLGHLQRLLMNFTAFLPRYCTCRATSKYGPLPRKLAPQLEAGWPHRRFSGAALLRLRRLHNDEPREVPSLS